MMGWKDKKAPRTKPPTGETNDALNKPDVLWENNGPTRGPGRPKSGKDYTATVGIKCTADLRKRFIMIKTQHDMEDYAELLRQALDAFEHMHNE